MFGRAAITLGIGPHSSSYILLHIGLYNVLLTGLGPIIE